MMAAGTRRTTGLEYGHWKRWRGRDRLCSLVTTIPVDEEGEFSKLMMN
jgi:hypothetical protein